MPSHASPSLFSPHLRQLSPQEQQESGGFPVDVSDKALFWHAPAPIAEATKAMLEEELINSTDELIYLLEEWLRLLGWLWIAEYIQSPLHNPRVEQLLFQWLVEGRRELSVGAWAYLGSTLSHLFESEHVPTKVRALQAFDYGDPNEPTTPLSRLLRYRNSFAHGSFAAVVQDILEHRRLLWGLLEQMEQLRHHPLIYWDTERESWWKANGKWEPFQDTGSLPTPSYPAQVWMLSSSEDETHLDLSHMVQIDPKARGIRYFSLQKESLERRRAFFFKREALKAHLERYEAMRQGELSFEESWSGEALPDLPEEQRNALFEKIEDLFVQYASKGPILTILGYPGSGKSGLLLEASKRLSHFDVTFLYRINHGDLTASASTCVRYFVRQFAQWLDEPQWLTKAEEQETPFEAFEQLLQLAWERGHRVLLGIDQFHLAYQPYQNEEQSLAQWIASLGHISNPGLGMLLTARPGYRDDLLGDGFIRLPISEYAKQEKYQGLLEELGLELRESSKKLTQEQVRFRRTLLFLLSAAPRPLTVFELCEVLERLWQQQPTLFRQRLIFTPQVERAVWELRPILRWESQEFEGEELRSYAPFCENFRRWLVEKLSYVINQH